MYHITSAPPGKERVSILSEKAIILSVLRIHVPGDHILHRLGLHDAHMAVHQLAALIKMDGGDGGDAVLLRDLRVIGGVELDDVQEGISASMSSRILENSLQGTQVVP